MQVTSKQGQWLGDIAVREAGSIHAIFELAQNANLSITDELIPGTLLDSLQPVDKRVISYYKQNGIFPATDSGKIKIGGIGFMGININFIVS